MIPAPPVRELILRRVPFARRIKAHMPRHTQMNQTRPAKIRTLNVEAQAVRSIETDDGKRLRPSDCAKFKERSARHPVGSCGHTAVAIWRSVEDGWIEAR
jgi:hypothetical protein